MTPRGGHREAHAHEFILPTAAYGNGAIKVPERAEAWFHRLTGAATERDYGREATAQRRGASAVQNGDRYQGDMAQHSILFATNNKG